MFSLAQRAEFFPLRDHAWRVWSAANMKDTKDKAAKDGWYRELMVRELGVYSSKELCPANDYCTAMAVMEAVAGGSYVWQPGKPKPIRVFEPGRIFWNHRATQTEQARRYLHAIGKLCAQHELEEEYVRETARRVGQLQSRPIIEQLTSPVLWKLLAALRIYVARQLAKEPALEEEPF
jgi:hypothetical protein